MTTSHKEETKTTTFNLKQWIAKIIVRIFATCRNCASHKSDWKIKNSLS